MSSGRRGFSLVEMLMVCALFGLLFSLVLQVLIPMMQGSQRGSQQTELQQLAFLTADRMANEIEQTGPQSIGLMPPGPGELPIRLALRPFVDVGPAGTQIYSPNLILYWWDDVAQRVWRATWQSNSLPSGGFEMLPTSSDFDSVIATPVNTTQIIASGVTVMEFTLAGSPPTLARLRMVLQAPSIDGHPAEHYELVRETFIRLNNYQ